MATELLKCPKCGAVMVSEGYHEYAWYLEGKRVEGCCSEPIHVKVGREDLSRLLAALEAADPNIVQKQEYQVLRAALQGN
jgi:hypothetical protein